MDIPLVLHYFSLAELELNKQNIFTWLFCILWYLHPCRGYASFQCKCETFHFFVKCLKGNWKAVKKELYTAAHTIKVLVAICINSPLYFNFNPSKTVLFMKTIIYFRNISIYRYIHSCKRKYVVLIHVITTILHVLHKCKLPKH